MKYFENAQVGDRVYSRICGFGIIKNVDATDDYPYPLIVKFDNNEIEEEYTLSGKLWLDDVEPTLFYVDGKNKYCEKRPTLTIKASQVPIDTKIFVDNDNIRKHFAGPPHYFWQYGQTSFTASKDERAISTFMYLAESVTVDSIVYPTRTLIIND